MSGLINKAKAAVSGNKSSHDAHVDNPQSANAGPHKSELMNKLDPRVDSDRESHGAHGARTVVGGTGNHPHHAPHGAHNPATAVPGTGGHAQHAPHGAHSPATGFTGHGTGAIVGSGHTANAGPHNSAVANKLDPRVDSDMDGSRRTVGAGVPGTGTYPQHATHGAHNPATAVGGHGSGVTPGSGTATNAGPHNSSMMNKLDPRVDSDMDGSRTSGGNATMR